MAIDRELRAIAAIEGQADVFLEEMARVYRQILKNITKLIDNPDLALTAQDIEKVLADSGYYRLGESVLTEGQAVAMRESIAVFNADLEEQLQYTPAAAQTLEAMRAMNATTWATSGTQMSTKLMKVTTDLMLGLASRPDTLELIANELDITSKQAGTWIRTTMADIHATSNKLLADEYASERMLEYIGPQDTLNRPFCAAHIGKKKTIEEWSKTLNDFGQPASIYRGGYNCRHQLHIAADEEQEVAKL